MEQVEEARVIDDTPRCMGCGTPLEQGAYKACDCPTGCAYRRSDMESVQVKPRCAWCNGIPTLANIDGEDLCHPCCNKWARAEGIAQTSPAQPKSGRG
jgi:hypothetical protein